MVAVIALVTNACASTSSLVVRPLRGQDREQVERDDQRGYQVSP
jgi:hypothetical protein